MSDIAIRAENLGKRYRIGQIAPYKTIREAVTNVASAPFRMATSAFRRQKSADLSPSGNTIWALKDASFEVKQGEVIGVIGRNGAGKTTLLKLLSRIATPTEGYAEIRGRVGSLLEVGTGFHPELTGRENIYLNGAILGMKKSQIEQRFDNIVDFAESEVKAFLDTPLKRYSTGMQVRLAFSVAAHLEPEILLVDEVLAVGDIMFQKKCLGKMEEVTRTGRTIFFVSHNLASIKTLCEKCMLIEAGKIKSIGETGSVIDEYLSMVEKMGAERIWDEDNAPASKEVRLKSLRILNDDGQPVSFLKISEPIHLEMQFYVLDPGKFVHTAFQVHRGGFMLFNSPNQKKLEDEGIKLGKGLHRVTCTIPANLLNDGLHSVSAHIVVDYKPNVRIPQVMSFTVQDDGSLRGSRSGPWLGEIRPILDWTHEQLE